MVSISSIGYFISYIAIGVLCLNMAARYYLVKLNFRAADLFLLTLAAAGLTNNHIIIETVIFFGLLISIFKEIVIYKSKPKVKMFYFILLAANSSVLFYIQTTTAGAASLWPAIIWLFVTMLLFLPAIQFRQQEVARLRNASFYHFIFRIAIVVFIHAYVEQNIIPLNLIYALLAGFVALVAFKIIYKKIVFTKMLSQLHVSATLLLLGLVFPKIGLGLLLVIPALIYLLDSDSISLQSHNRRWLQFLEWPVWHSPILLLLILGIHGIKEGPLLLRGMFVLYIILIGGASIFCPQKIEQAGPTNKQRNVVLAKNVLILIVIVVLEARI